MHGPHRDAACVRLHTHREACPCALETECPGPRRPELGQSLSPELCVAGRLVRVTVTCHRQVPALFWVSGWTPTSVGGDRDCVPPLGPRVLLPWQPEFVPFLPQAPVQFASSQFSSKSLLQQN